VSINKIYIMTLERSGRLPYTLGAMGGGGVPMEIVESVFGIDDIAYKKSVDLCKDAIKDGFDVFQEILDAGHHETCPIIYLCQRWNRLRLLRRIADENNISFVFYDDFCLHNYSTCGRPVSYSNFDELVAYLCELGEFKNLVFEEDFENTLPYPNINVRDFAWGLFPFLYSGNDNAFVASPAGAAWLIETFNGLPHLRHFEDMLWHLRHGRETVKQPFGNWTSTALRIRFIFSSHEQTQKYMPTTIHTDFTCAEVLRPVEETS